MCKKANIKTSRELKGENHNLIIFRDDEKENEDIFPMQIHTSNSTRLSYLQAKLQQVSTNISSKQLLTPSFSTLSKLVVQNLANIFQLLQYSQKYLK